MTIRKVRANSVYIYEPVLIDLLHGPTGLAAGTRVRVKNLAGCPPANTMGHCHVVDASTGTFIGMVCCNSLQHVEAEVELNRLREEMERSRCSECGLTGGQHLEGCPNNKH
jgi:hypothetical protein